MNKSIIKNLFSSKEHYYEATHTLKAEGLLPSDIMLVSYPRSGNTLLRFVLANVLYDSDIINCLEDLNDLVPDIHHGIKKNINYSTPRAIKTHQPFWFRHEPHNKELYKKNIYIIRHPFDVLCSYYDFQLYFWKIETSFDEFIKKCVYGSFFTSWQEHVLSWYTVRNEREILFLRYEDIRDDFEKSVTKIATFLNNKLSENEIQRIKEKSSIDNMKILEKKGSIVDGNFNFIKTEEEKKKTYKKLTDDMKGFVYEHFKEAMDIFEYKIK